MRVYVVLGAWEYETREVLAVADSLKAAKRLANENLREEQIAGQWNREPGIPFTWSRDLRGSGHDSQDIERREVER